MLVSDQEVLALSLQQYRSFMDSAEVVVNTADAEMINRIGRSIAESVENFMTFNGRAHELENIDWEFSLVKDNSVNAFAMPGGKVVVFTGMLPVAESEAHLAVVIAHEITNKPYLKAVASKKKPVIMSTGMCEMDEIETAVHVLTQNGLNKEDIILLHCNTEYPTPFEDVNLLAMLDIRNKTGIETGYSDHTRGIEVPIAAVALGARVIEKHFTLDRNLPGPDHKASLEPQELKAMVNAIRNIEKALSGSGIKEPGASEIKNKDIARKSIVAATTIRRGEVLTAQNLGVKRPGNGISPMRWDEVLGQRAIRDFEQDECIEL